MNRPGAGPQHDAEAGLVERLRAGDPDACESLVRSHGGRLLAVARRILHNEEDARDAVQESFLAAFRSIHSFESGSSLSTWIHRITINACLMKLRAGSRRPETSIEDLLPRFDETGHHAAPLEDWSESAEAALQRQETRKRVRKSIESLPEKYRTVLVLRDIEELSTEETARLLRVTPTAVKVRLHRARQALRTQLATIFGRSTGLAG